MRLGRELERLVGLEEVVRGARRLQRDHGEQRDRDQKKRSAVAASDDRAAGARAIVRACMCGRSAAGRSGLRAPLAEEPAPGEHQRQIVAAARIAREDQERAERIGGNVAQNERRTRSTAAFSGSTWATPCSHAGICAIGKYTPERKVIGVMTRVK